MLFIISLLIAAGSAIAWISARKKVRDERNLMFKTTANIMGSLAIIFLLIAITQCFTQIPAGHVGVVDFFGVVSDRTLPAGIQAVNPMAEVVKFSIQTKEHKELMQVLSREGLTIGLEISALYRLNPDSAAQVYKTILGGDYENIMLVPNFRSISRSVTASFQASALYSTEREKLGVSIQDELARMVSTRGIIIESTPLRNVSLPSQLTEAIEQKQRADQESQRMQFILAKEKQEADRKRIEAQGISDFQNIVARNISEQLLRWKGIEATEKIAQSPNTKVIVIGAGKDGLPLILDTK
jgi:regulator of protease activity HflC (stomatin/prohibitin superfamily)